MNRTIKPQVRDSGGLISLGRELGHGGEGSVYEVLNRQDMVAKVYHNATALDRAAKIEAMAAMKTGALLSLTAWPVDLLRTSGGNPCGLLMPIVTGHKDIHHLYSPRSRKTEFPNADWRFLIRAATNTARAFALIHEAGCVIGDVNYGGVTVSDRATVKLIDCDSFQVRTSGQLFLCEVGVPEFTPPELQGKPFKGVVRTPNHDNFGLAVLVFQLLFMARHPFAGRYLGVGDMPIERAITEFRFAYGSGRAAAQMQPPPNVPDISSASIPVALLFERAFSQGSVDGARPTAREWIAGLEGLEKQLRQCQANASHYFTSGLQACPWCRYEAATGVTLFNVYVHHITGRGSSFDITLAWRKIAMVQAPGPPPELVNRQDLGLVEPCQEALNARGEPLMRLIGAVFVLAIIIPLLIEFPMAWLLWIVGGFFVIKVVGTKKENIQIITDFTAKYDAAKNKYLNLKTRWDIEATDRRFVAKLKALEDLRKQWQDIPNVRQCRYRELEQERKKAQLRRFLEGFTIEGAAIPAIGSGRKAMLQSYNVETAWDIADRTVSRIPGFGPALTMKLIEWRRSVERKFSYDPSKGVDPQDIATLDREMVDIQQELERHLIAAPAELTQIANQVTEQRNALEKLVNDAFRAMVQAEVDMNTAKG